jgi:hypothetical protein
MIMQSINFLKRISTRINKRCYNKKIILENKSERINHDEKDIKHIKIKNINEFSNKTKIMPPIIQKESKYLDLKNKVNLNLENVTPILHVSEENIKTTVLPNNLKISSVVN